MEKKVLFFLMIWLIPCMVMAQGGLHANAVFAGKVVSQDQMVEVKVRGRALSKYRLNFYHSVRFNANIQQKNEINNLIEHDRQHAVSVELRSKGKKTSLIMSFVPRGKTNRYLCYLISGSGKCRSITLVYMEGSVSSIDELRKLIG